MAADPAEITPRDRRNQRRYALWTIVWFIALVGTQALFRFRRGLVPSDVIAWSVGAMPLLAGAVALWAWSRYLHEAEELERRIQLNALALGFGATFVSVISYTALLSAGAPMLEARYQLAPGIFVYVLAQLYGRWQYR